MRFGKAHLRPMVAAAIVLLAGGIAFWFATLEYRGKERVRVREPIAICYTWTHGLLIGVAQGQGLFADHGLAATIKQFSSGLNALDALLAGACDLTNTAETSIVFRGFERQDFRIVATTRSDANHNQIVARRDRGVHAPGDLRGKRVGLLPLSNAHFFLYRYLLEHGLTTRDVVLTFADGVPALRSALLQGKVDAVVLWQPHVGHMKKALGTLATVFAAPGLVLTTTNIVAREQLIRDRPEVISRVLRALEQARVLGLAEPQTALDAVSRVTGVPPREINEAWLTTHKLSLTQELLLSLEDEGRWALKSGLVGQAELPNYLLLLYLEGLESVAPQAVTVLH